MATITGQPGQLVLGTPGDDSIILSYNDTVDAGGGNNQISANYAGGSGDIILYNKGYRNLDFTPFFGVYDGPIASAGSATLKLGPGISASDVTCYENLQWEQPIYAPNRLLK